MFSISFPLQNPIVHHLPTSKLSLKPAQNFLKQSNIHRVVSVTTPEPSPILDQNHRPINVTINSNPCNELQEDIQESVTSKGKFHLTFHRETYYLTGPGIFQMITVPQFIHLMVMAIFELLKSMAMYSIRQNISRLMLRKKNAIVKPGEWKFTHRGPFSVLRGGKKFGNTKVMKNVANTSVLKWGGKLLCLWEGGDPYEIDIENDHLETVGIFDLINRHHLKQSEDIASGAVNQISEDAKVDSGDGGGGFLGFCCWRIFKMPPKRLLSHYKIDPTLDRLLTVSCNAEDMLIPRSSFTFHEFDSNFKLLQKQEFDLPEHMMIHDWAFTETHYVLFGNRIKLDVPGSMLALSGLSPMITALSVNPNKPTSPIYVLPRFPDKVKGDRDWKIPVEAPLQMWVLHAGNAFELTDQRGNLEIQIHAAICSYKWFNFHKMFGYDWKTGKLDPSFMNAGDGDENTLPHLVKVSIKLQSDGNFEECSVEALNNWSKPTDFPAINPAFSGSNNTCIYAAILLILPPDLFFVYINVNFPRLQYAVSIQKCYMVILDLS
ncbi:hypothetical protein MKW92_018978 [Papaver armeniacum]|nr:hypothetical protein MKW92_018978 [Papaver armeniacum]